MSSDRLSDDAVKWLQRFAKHSIRKALLSNSEVISEDVYKELASRCLVLPAKGNDGDYPWYGRVEITTDLAGRIFTKLGIDFEIEMMCKGL